MDSQTPEPRTDLKSRLLQLLRAGLRGTVLASLTLVTTGESQAAATPEKNQPSLEERIRNLRDKQDGARTEAGTSEVRDNLLAWGNWHNWNNWRNGWNNGWGNWHNWHNW